MPKTLTLCLLLFFAALSLIFYFCIFFLLSVFCVNLFWCHLYANNTLDLSRLTDIAKVKSRLWSTKIYVKIKYYKKSLRQKHTIVLFWDLFKKYLPLNQTFGERNKQKSKKNLYVSNVCLHFQAVVYEPFLLLLLIIRK